MAETTGDNANTNPTPKPKAAKVGFAPDTVDTAPITTNEAGQQVGKDGYPLAAAARAIALAADGKKSDPEGIVTADDIAAHDPAAAEADREAVAKFHADQAEAARKEAEKAAAEAAKTEKE